MKRSDDERRLCQTVTVTQPFCFAQCSSGSVALLRHIGKRKDVPRD